MTLNQNAIRFAFLMIASFGLAVPLHALGDRPVSVSQNQKEDAVRKAFHKSFAVGAAIPGTKLNKAERQLLFANFNTVTPENCMKPAALQPAEGRFRFAKADALVEMARANGLSVNAHALLWHKQCPDWFFMENGRQAGRERVLQRMQTHIATVAGHFSGKGQIQAAYRTNVL
jgi:endo-1,4-beta-xylanase